MAGSLAQKCFETAVNASLQFKAVNSTGTLLKSPLITHQENSNMLKYHSRKWQKINLALLIGGLLFCVMLGPIYLIQGPKAMSLNVEFTDQVSNFGTRSGYVMVLFAKQAAGYELSMERDDFAEQIGNLAAAWKSGKPVNVVLERGVQIRSISAHSDKALKSTK
ncbi:MAG: hypothetical protein ACK499_11890 [Betaproteobacteria bacterium]|nr:hypothetical protein AEM42_15425 [Betaproteobacteria bacterium UKL13-2]